MSNNIDPMNDKTTEIDNPIDDFIQAAMFAAVELDLPLPIPNGNGCEKSRAFNYLEEISSGLIREDNSFICIDYGEIVYVRVTKPEKYNIQRGDIVKPAPVLRWEEIPNFLLRRFDWAINFDYPEGYHLVLSDPDEDDEILLESLITGERRCLPAKGWVKIGFAGISLLEPTEED